MKNVVLVLLLLGLWNISVRAEFNRIISVDKKVND